MLSLPVKMIRLSSLVRYCKLTAGLVFILIGNVLREILLGFPKVSGLQADRGVAKDFWPPTVG